MIACGLIIVGAILIQVIDARKRRKYKTKEDDELSVVSSAKQE
jgi:hypothetical protein